MGCHVQGEVIKRLCFRGERSLSLAGPVGNQLPCRGAAPWRGPCGRDQGLPTITGEGLTGDPLR